MSMKRKGSFKAGPKAKKAKKVGNQTKFEKVQTRPNPLEHKVFDLDTTTTVTTAGTIVNMYSAFTQGVGYRNAYLARIVTPVGLDIRWHAVGPGQYTGAAGVLTDLYANIRLIVYQWFDSAIPTMSGTVQTVASILSPINIDNYQNINVLMDEIISLDCTTYEHDVGAQTYTNKAGRRYIKGKKMGPIELNTGAGQFQDGGIYYAVYSVSGSAPHPALEVYLRLTAVDA